MEGAMPIIGFDVSKNELVAVRIDRSGNKQAEYILENAREPIDQFLKRFRSKYKYLTVIAESTSDYHRPLAMSCLREDVPFKLINPLTTKQFVRATVRKRKTDLTDAHIIAKLGLQGEGRIMTTADFTMTKPISRTAFKVSEMRKSVARMQERFGRLSESEADPKVNEVLESLRIQLERGAKELRAHLNTQTNPRLHKLLKTIPGIGPITADILLAEIGDIERFKDGKSLVAFAGFDPKVRQSGATLSRNTRLTKRGSPYLRQAIFFATSVAQLHDQEFKDYYQKKRNEGRGYTEATIAGSRKLTYRIFAVWKRGTPYLRTKT
jgi:transposase